MIALLARGALSSLLAACTLGACAVPQGAAKHLLVLPRVEEAALDDCYPPVHAKLCGARPDAGGACWEAVKTRYGALRDTVERKRFLIDSGCPSPRVEAWLPDPR